MAPFIPGIINAVVLILVGLSLVFHTENTSISTWIPVITGLVLLLLAPALLKKSRFAIYLSHLFSILSVLALFIPLRAAIENIQVSIILRTSVMMFTSMFAAISLIRATGNEH